MGQRLDAALTSGQPTFSFEFFPPKTDEGERNLWKAIEDLAPLSPTFVSVTYGAGGSTRDRTLRITARLVNETDMHAVAHLTCVNATVPELTKVLDSYREVGIANLLALRGDPPGDPGGKFVPTPGGFDHADQLVALAAARDEFTIGVAAYPEGHPESPSLEHDAEILAGKQRAGASFAVTQVFFRTADYFSLLTRARAAGAGLPIIPGLMPLTNIAQMERFARLSGQAFPAELAARFQAVADDPVAVAEMGVQVATEMGRELLAGGAPGLHFYTLNRSPATREILARLANQT